MALKRDLSDLPAADKDAGMVPDPQPYFAPQLAQAWADTLDDGSKAMAFPAARIRHSQAAGCARAISYGVRGVEATEPPDIAARWVMGLGTRVHELWQERMAELFPHAEIEKKVWIERCKSAGHIDLFMETKGSEPGEPERYATTMELKTINGFGFKMAIGARGPADGPRPSAVTQAALNGYATDADRITIVYLAMENLSPREAVKVGAEPWRRFCAEWSMPREQYEPIAEAEINRFVKILQLVDDGKQVPRAIPGTPLGSRIVDVDKGAWRLLSTDGEVLQAGTTWQCAYCDFQSQCRSDGP